MQISRRNQLSLLVLSLSCLLPAVMVGQGVPVPPRTARLCIGENACANLTWNRDHYDGRRDNDTVVSSRYWIKAWRADGIELRGLTVEPTDGVHQAVGLFHGKISPDGNSLISASYDWNVGPTKTGTSEFWMTWENAAPPSTARLPVQTAQPVATQMELPNAMTQCEGDQCTRGGGGAVWVFDGPRGQAMWHYGAIAALTVLKFDGHNIVIHREDPNPSYSSPRFADPKKRSDGVFFADYYGVLQGDRIDGTVVWNGGGSGPFYAILPKTLCQPFNECPLDAGQMVQLGQNALKARLSAAALHCFLISSAEGNSDAQSLAGLMLRDGQGVPPNEKAAFYLLTKSAQQENYNGELGLASMYDSGLGTPKDPAQAAIWRNKAQARLNQFRAEQQQNQTNEAMGVLLFVGAAAALLAAEASSDSPSSSDHRSSNYSDENRRIQSKRDWDYWTNGGTNLSAPPGYKCSSGAC
jgi:hypothetical protein